MCATETSLKATRLKLCFSEPNIVNPGTAGINIYSWGYNQECIYFFPELVLLLK